MKIRPVAAKFMHAGRQTERHGEANSPISLFNINTGFRKEQINESKY